MNSGTVTAPVAANPNGARTNGWTHVRSCIARMHGRARKVACAARRAAIAAARARGARLGPDDADRELEHDDDCAAALLAGAGGRPGGRRGRPSRARAAGAADGDGRRHRGLLSRPAWRSAGWSNEDRPRPRPALRGDAVGRARCDNIADAARAATVELAIVQSDTQDGGAARRPAPSPRPGRSTDLRAVMALFPEPLTLVARADAGIAGLERPRRQAGQRRPAGLGPARADRGADGSARLDARPPSRDARELRPVGGGQRALRGADRRVLLRGRPARRWRSQEATSGCGAGAGRRGRAGGRRAGRGRSGSVRGRRSRRGLYAGVDRGRSQTFGVGATLVTRADAADDDDRDRDRRDPRRPVARSRGLDPTLARLDPAAMARAGPDGAAPSRGGEAAFRARGRWSDAARGGLTRPAPQSPADRCASRGRPRTGARARRVR